MSAVLNTLDREAELHALNADFSTMPPVNAMAIRATKFDAGVLSVSAPLANNVNDKACAFGGSLVSVMTMASWGLLSELCRREQIQAEVYIADTQARFLAPLFGDLNAQASLHTDTDWKVFLQTLRSKGRARAIVQSQIKNEQGQTMCEMTARFAAIRSKNE
ncbi:MAG: YiiD C-terminal domain-containing protein [Arenimonas sp.]